MNRRVFAKRAALGIPALGLAGAGFKCSGPKITFYVQTISAFLNELGGLIPSQVAFINQIIKVAADFDAAYQRGDFANASTFFNSMVADITTLTESLGVTLTSRMKMLLSVVSATVRTIALLLKDAGVTQPSAAASARRTAPKSTALIERLANEAAVNATFEAVKLH